MSYRPRISAKQAKSLLTVLNVGIQHMELTNEQAADVLLFMNKLSEQDQIAQVLERLRMTVPDFEEPEPDEVTPKPFQKTTYERKASAAHAMSNESDWPDDSLEHFIMVYEDDPSKVEEVAAAQNELTRRREQQIRPIRPPSDLTP